MTFSENKREKLKYNYILKIALGVNGNSLKRYLKQKD